MFTKKEAKELQDKFKTYSLPEIIEKHKLNKAHLARLMGMPVGTFKNKVLKNVAAYRLTTQESVKLLGILKEFCKDLGKVVIEGGSYSRVNQSGFESEFDAISAGSTLKYDKNGKLIRQQTYKKP